MDNRLGLKQKGPPAEIVAGKIHCAFFRRSSDFASVIASLAVSSTLGGRLLRGKSYNPAGPSTCYGVVVSSCCGWCAHCADLGNRWGRLAAVPHFLAIPGLWLSAIRQRFELEGETGDW